MPRLITVVGIFEKKLISGWALSRGAVLTTRADFFNTLQEGTSDDISNRSSNSTIDRAKYSQISVSKFSSWEIHNKLKTISSQNLVDLLPDNATEENTVLLRYPILIKNRSIRDKFFRQTKEYGVSILYPRPLNEISGLEGILDSQSFPCANEFSDHLVTLPTHEHVDKKLIYNILAVLKKEPGRQP